MINGHFPMKKRGLQCKTIRNSLSGLIWVIFQGLNQPHLISNMLRLYCVHILAPPLASLRLLLISWGRRFEQTTHPPHYTISKTSREGRGELGHAGSVSAHVVNHLRPVWALKYHPEHPIVAENEGKTHEELEQ